jgi:hypothetical protein
LISKQHLNLQRLPDDGSCLLYAHLSVADAYRASYDTEFRKAAAAGLRNEVITAVNDHYEKRESREPIETNDEAQMMSEWETLIIRPDFYPGEAEAQALREETAEQQGRPTAYAALWAPAIGKILIHETTRGTDKTKGRDRFYPIDELSANGYTARDGPISLHDGNNHYFMMYPQETQAAGPTPPVETQKDQHQKEGEEDPIEDPAEQQPDEEEDDEEATGKPRTQTNKAAHTNAKVTRAGTGPESTEQTPEGTQEPNHHTEREGKRTTLGETLSPGGTKRPQTTPPTRHQSPPPALDSEESRKRAITRKNHK